MAEKIQRLQKGLRSAQKSLSGVRRLEASAVAVGLHDAKIDFLPLQQGISLDKTAAEARLREYLDEAAAAEQKICEKLKLCLLPACTPSQN